MVIRHRLKGIASATSQILIARFRPLPDEYKAHMSQGAEMLTASLMDWATTVGGTLLIELGRLVEGQGGGLCRDESMDLLGDALADAGTGPVVFASRRPPTKMGIRLMDVIGLEKTAAQHAILADAPNAIRPLAGHVHGVHRGRVKHHRVAAVPTICRAFAPNRRTDAPVGFFTGPVGCAVIDKGRNGLWYAVPLDPADRSFPL